MEKGLVVAITGQSGSGKSSFGKIYENLGYTVIDCDKIAASITGCDDCKNKLVEYFGTSIVKDGKIDKKELSNLAFKEEKTLDVLTAITHPFIIKEILRIIQECFEGGEAVVFVDGAVIIGHSFERYCDKIIVVAASLENQCARLMDRDNISYSQGKNRILKQMELEQMIKKADYVVHNNSTKDDLKAQGKKVLEKILKDERGDGK
ncbi:MAG: dephospho-CoA kinase [Oscillospiraceae bacterium]